MSRRHWLVLAAVAGLATMAAGPVAAQSAAPPVTGPVKVGAGTVNVGTAGTTADLDLTDAEKTAAAAAGAGKLVGIIALTMDTEYHQNLNNTIKSNLQGLGFTVEICDTKNADPVAAVTCFEQFTQRNAAAIVTANAAATLGTQVTDAIKNGTIVVQVTGIDLGTTGAVGISVPEASLGAAEGKLAGEYAASQWPDTDVQAIILDYPSVPTLVTRADGIESGMTAANPHVKVVARLLGGLPENGTTSMEQALQQYPELKIVTGINDGGDLGAYTAAKTAGKSGNDLAIFGIDCDPAAVEAIDSGNLYKGCVNTNPTGTGVLAANAVAKLIAGGTVPGSVEVPTASYSGASAAGSPVP